MTIGIGTSGKKAGEAVFRALQAVERVTTGSIGGFAVYAVIKDDGKVQKYTTQRGGTKTLITHGETTGVLPPEDILQAKIAAIISSGPDRPEPLEKVIPSKDNIGLVTGHRIPMATCRVTGKPLNSRVLELMESGLDAIEAVNKVMDDNSNADAGLIAVDIKGNVGIRNSSRVSKRPDVAMSFKENKESGAKVAVLMNEIHPEKSAAELAAETAIMIMSEARKPDIEILVKTGLKVEAGNEDLIYVNKNNEATRIVTTDEWALKGEAICVTPYLLSKVLKEGKEIGYTIEEPLTILK
ncbi:MAG TPA: hypothetical protein ENI51_09000, partial [Candidatus Atribacteria bacterium]|nr:hypothetical protein [Candidatus Atribacteria bacterium]